MDTKVDGYLKRQTKQNREIIDTLRNLILMNCPALIETGMDEGLWYEGKFYIATIGDHVNLGVGIKGLTQEEVDCFEGNGKTMRHLKFYPGKGINQENLLPLLNLVYTKTN